MGALWLVPALPLVGFLVLSLAGGRLGERAIAAVAVGAVGLAALAAGAVVADFIAFTPAQGHYQQTLWQWLDVAGLRVDIGLYLDQLAALMILVVTVVGFFIHLYSARFMAGDEGYRRYFAYLNLFIGSMLIVVLADNLLWLFLGWEGVGLCSYLLIGYWYQDEGNGTAARKAFIVTRIADTAFAVGLFVIYTQLHTFDIHAAMARAPAVWPAGAAAAAEAAAALLLAGALGKSGQFPFQVWLPDAMAGPTPVSALIHAATMVVAGVYLLARLHVLYSLAPVVQGTVAAVGAFTLLLAAGAALGQRDIKRALAYSTISQIGYMYLALGVGAWSAAIFHLMTHAFFKALLFLSAGVVIEALHHEHDIFKMGGLRRALPVAFWGFLIGAASLAALPLVTAGFYSKDEILWSAWASSIGGAGLWTAGWVGAFLTGIYIFRIVFIVFFGPQRTPVARRAGTLERVPIVVLSVLALVTGLLWIPPILGNVTLLGDFLQRVLPPIILNNGTHGLWLMELLAMGASVGGIYAAYGLFGARHPVGVRARASPVARRIDAAMYAGWGFDAVYDRLLLRPFLRLAERYRTDPVDAFYEGVAALCRGLYYVFSALHNGRLRWYAAGLTVGSVVLLTLAAVL